MRPAIDLSVLERLKQARVALSSQSAALSLAQTELDALLPDGGLPAGVTELRSAHLVNGATEVATMAIRAAQRQHAQAWCAWIDPENTLYAPRLLQAGVDLDRLLVVRPPRAQLERIALRVAASGAFELVVVDMDAVRGAASARARNTHQTSRTDVFVRKLALHTEKEGTRIVLLSDAHKPHAMPWPVALRLEIAHATPHALSVRVSKERHGRMGQRAEVPLSRLTG